MTGSTARGEVMAVRLRALRKEFADVVAVDGVDLDVRDGEFMTLLGPSGSGKTTVLRMIAGFELPTGGTVQLAGVDVTRVAPSERNVNTVFQDYALFPHMTVLENVEYGLRVKGLGRRERRHKANEVLERVRVAILDEFLEGAPISKVLRSRPMARIAIRSWIGLVEAASIEWLATRDVPRDSVRDLLVDALFDMLGRVLAPRDARRYR